MLKRYPRQLGSTVNPQKYSATIKSLIPLVLLVALKFGYDIEATDLDNFVTTSFVAINGCVAVYYAGRRIINKYFKK